MAVVAGEEGGGTGQAVKLASNHFRAGPPDLTALPTLHALAESATAVGNAGDVMDARLRLSVPPGNPKPAAEAANLLGVEIA